VRDFRELQVWEKAHQLTLAVYQATTSLPPEEKFGLTSQLRRAAASIPTNIAEGCGRTGERELARFLQIAMGSASELEYNLLLAHELGFVDGALYHQLQERTIEVKRMMTGFIRKLTADG
jgi:four helix bundle protein